MLPGETHQPLHRDELAWDFFPFPLDYDVQCNTMWAMTDFTVENGATRIVPGSHFIEGKQTYDDDDPRIVRAEMERGSMFFYSGKVYHGAAANNVERGPPGDQHHLLRRAGFARKRTSTCRHPSRWPAHSTTICSS